MGAIPKNVIREIIKENDFKNPGEIYAYLRDGFVRGKIILQSHGKENFLCSVSSFFLTR